MELNQGIVDMLQNPVCQAVMLGFDLDSALRPKSYDHGLMVQILDIAHQILGLDPVGEALAL